MRTKDQQDKHLLLAIANFVAAFGGGTILGRGIGVINVPYLHAGTLLAFFLGTLVCLLLLQCIPKHITPVLTRWFSMLSALMSVLLLFVLTQHAQAGALLGGAAWLFFGILTLRFAFWFYSRAARVALVAGQEQRIAWVEFGYYSGIIVGLVFWRLLDVNIAMSSALLVDIILQFFAGLIDLHATHSGDNTSTQTSSVAHQHKLPATHQSNQWYWRLTVAVVLLTIGVQVVTFDLAHKTSDSVNTYILAFFYLGVAIAALVCKKCKIQLYWPHHYNHPGYAALLIAKVKTRISFILLLVLTALSVSLSIFILGRWLLLYHKISHTNLGATAVLLASIGITGFVYEVLALALLDRIGLEEQKSNHQIVRTYGLMGLGAALSFWFLSLTHSSWLSLLGTLFACLLLSWLAVWRRGEQRSFMKLSPFK